VASELGAVASCVRVGKCSGPYGPSPCRAVCFSPPPHETPTRRTACWRWPAPANPPQLPMSHRSRLTACGAPATHPHALSTHICTHLNLVHRARQGGDGGLVVVHGPHGTRVVVQRRPHHQPAHPAVRQPHSWPWRGRRDAAAVAAAGMSAPSLGDWSIRLALVLVHSKSSMCGLSPCIRVVSGWFGRLRARRGEHRRGEGAARTRLTAAVASL
jgi:hypothetical protein